MYHVLFISYDGLTDPLGQSQIIPYLSGLAKFGYRFTVISCEKPEKFQQHKAEIKKILSQYPISWQPLTYHKWPPVLSSVFDLQKIKQKARTIHAIDKIDMVHTRSGTPALAGLWLKNKFGIKFLNDIRDFYAQSRVDSGQWPQNKLIYKLVFNFFQKKEKQELANSDGVVCLTHKAESILKSTPEFQTNTPLRVIPCSVDLKLFDPEKIDGSQKDLYKKQFGFASNDIVFSYLGSIGTWYLTKEMFTFFKVVSTKYTDAKFLIISPDDENLIRSFAASAGMHPDRISVVNAPRSSVPTLLSLSHYSVFFIKPCYSKQASSPTKLGEILAMGIPVIANSCVGDVGEIIEKYQAGIVIDQLDSHGYETAIDKIGKMQFNKEVIRAGAINYFDLNIAINKYREIYSHLLSEEMRPEIKKENNTMYFQPIKTQ